jgi:hypothetical protein
MTAEVGTGTSSADIHAVADEAWLSRVRNETGAEPFLDDDGAVVIPVTSGSGPLLQGAPADRTIKLPALDAHQARVTVALGTSTLQQVIIDAHERLEEVSLDRSGGRINDLTLNASRDDRALKVTGEVDVGALRLRRGSFALSPPLIRPTSVIDLRDTGVVIIGDTEIIGDTVGEAAQLLLSGHIRFRSSWRVRSSHVAPRTVIETSTTSVWLGVVNPEQGVSGNPPVEMMLCLPGRVVCEYLPPASRVHLENGRLELQHPGSPRGCRWQTRRSFAASIRTPTRLSI